MSNKLSVGLAKKLQQMLQGQAFPQSALKGALVERMLELGIFAKKLSGRGIQYLAISDYLRQYLANELGIQDLNAYIEALEQPSTKSKNALVSGDSKISSVAVAKGFSVKTVGALSVYWKGEGRSLSHWEDTALWVQSPEHLQLLPATTVVCIENIDSFNRIAQQSHRFPANSIYISRYYSDGQSLQRWLSQQQGIAYIHFGDFDLAGLQIYLSEFKPYIERNTSSYYSPVNLPSLLQEHGNAHRYFKQAKQYNHQSFADVPELTQIYQVLITEQKALEQEVLWEM